MNQEQLQRATQLEGNYTTLGNLIAGLEGLKSDDVALAVTEVGDGPLIGDGDDVFVERGGLIEYLRGQRDFCKQQLQGLGVEV